MSTGAPTYDEFLEQNRQQASLIDQLRAQVETLKAQVRTLHAELEQARRAGERQAAPFSIRVSVLRCPASFVRIQGQHPEPTSDALGTAAVQFGPRLLGFVADLTHRLSCPNSRRLYLISLQIEPPHDDGVSAYADRPGR